MVQNIQVSCLKKHHVSKVERQNFMISPKLRNTIKWIQNIRMLHNILATSVNIVVKSIKTIWRWVIYNFLTMWICFYCYPCQGKVEHPAVSYLPGEYIPTHFNNSPVAQNRLILKVKENEPRHSDSTASSIRNITSHLHFLKALTFKSSITIKNSDSQPGQRYIYYIYLYI